MLSRNGGFHTLRGCQRPPNQQMEVKLAAACRGSNENVPLRNGDVLAIRQVPQWNDLGASVTVRGEVQHPAPYGIQPGERLSSLLPRCNGLRPGLSLRSGATPPGSPGTRDEVSTGTGEADQDRGDLSEVSAGRRC